MISKKNERAINNAITKVNEEIAFNSLGGFYARGLATEGYAGGYRQALQDVLLLLNDVQPNTRTYWTD